MSKRIFTHVTNSQVAELLKNGAVGVLPSDTQYGLMARAADQAAVEKLYAIKKRNHKPGTVIAANSDQLVELGLKRRYLKPVEHYWPNPISIVIPTGFNLKHLHRGKLSLAVRIPADANLQKLLADTGPLVTTSANMPGGQPASTIAEAQTIFGEKVDFYVDGGDLSGRKPSTVIRIVDDVVEVLREGAVLVGEDGSFTL